MKGVIAATLSANQEKWCATLDSFTVLVPFFLFLLFFSPSWAMQDWAMDPQVWNLLLIQGGACRKSHKLTKLGTHTLGNATPMAAPAVFLCVRLLTLSHPVSKLYNSIPYIPQTCVFHTVTQVISYSRLILFWRYYKPLSITEYGERSVKGLLLQVKGKA